MTYTDLIVDHIPKLKTYATNLHRGNEANAEDLLQSAIYKLLLAKRKGRYSEKQVFGRFAYTIMRNEFINWYRKRTARIETELVENHSVYSEAYIVDNIDIKQVEGVLDTLSMKQKQVLVLFMEGHTYEEIAEICNAPMGTIKSRIHLARKKVSSELEKLNKIKL